MPSFSEQIANIAASAVKGERTGATSMRSNQVTDAAAGVSGNVDSVNGSMLNVTTLDGSRASIAAGTKVLRAGDPVIIFGGRAM